MLRAILTTAIITLGAAAATAGDTRYSVNGVPYDGFLVRAEVPRGAIVILPGWAGLSAHEKDRAQALAELGYTAFAADLHPSGSAPLTEAAWQARRHDHLSDTGQMQAVVTAAVTHLRETETAPLLLMGYALGAVTTMEAAWSGLGSELDVAGYIVFSGCLSDRQGRMMPDRVAPFFVAQGEAETRVGRDALDMFKSDVDMAGGRVTAVSYPGVGQLFSTKASADYDATADRDSWQVLQLFLAGLDG